MEISIFRCLAPRKKIHGIARAGLLAGAGSAFVFGLAFLLPPQPGHVPWLFLYFAVVAGSWFGGAGAGAGAALATALLAHCLVRSPGSPLLLGREEAMTQLSYFLLSLATVVVVRHGRNRFLSRREKQAEEAGRRANEELEARVQQRTQQLQQANRELKSFSYCISHELRAPVRVISGFSQIIHEDFGNQLPAEAARLFGVIRGNAERMGELIDDLLAFSQLSARHLERQPVNMMALAQSAVAELNQSQGQNQASLRLEELPAAPGDASMLRQVFTNLIANALKFSRRAAAPRVEIGAWQEERRNVYFVRDNGVGFSMKYAGKLFKVFQRLHDPEQFEGTGVGLAIVQLVIQRHGGEVWAEAQPEAGATFFFSLPVERTLSHPRTVGKRTEGLKLAQP